MTYASTNTATTAPHSNNAALRSESPYQQRTTERENPAQQLIKQAVEFLLQQLEAGKSETLTAYLAAMARFTITRSATFSPSPGSARPQPALRASARGTSWAGL